jgi:hypothetical protein
MSEHITGIDVHHAQHPKRGQVTRLCWQGWQVDIDGLSVSVPPQDTTGTIDDLATLLGAAYRMLDIPIIRRPHPLTVLRAAPPEPLAAELVAILSAAQHIADRRWDRRASDVYACTSQAWQDAGMTVPYALLLATLRAALPQAASSLAGYEYVPNAQPLHTLYDRAIAPCCTEHPGTARPSRIA